MTMCFLSFLNCILIDDRKHVLSDVLLHEVPAEWGFNRLLVSLFREMDSGDLQTAMTCIKERNLLPEESLLSIKSSLDLFDILRDEGILGINNIEILKIILYKIGKETLIKRAMEYTRRHSGFVQLQPIELHRIDSELVHVYSKGLSRRLSYTVFIHAFRSLISTVLFIPSDQYLIAGIETLHFTRTQEDSAIVLTIHLPNFYASAFEKILTEGTNIRPLRELFICLIELKNHVFRITDEHLAIETFQTETN